MKKATIILIFSISSLSAEPLHFPPGLNSNIEIAEVKTGDTVVIKSGPVWVLDRKAHDLFAASIEKGKATDSLVSTYLNTSDTTASRYHELMDRYERIDSIQKLAIDSINSLTFKTDSLLKVSRGNTRRAVGQSFLVSALLGGIAGFTIPRDKELWVNAASAFSGALIGTLINFIILR